MQRDPGQITRRVSCGGLPAAPAGLLPWCVNSFFLDMQVRFDAPPPAFATAIPAMFEALADVFAPLDVTIHADDDEDRVARIDPARVFNTVPLWCDEELTREALTRCPPALGTDVIADLYVRLANIAPASFSINAHGALFHRPAHAEAPGWYGRWRAAELTELVSVHFQWTTDPWRGFVIKCPAGGYPFTPVRLTTTKAGAGDPAIAAQNRALWLPALARVRAALGFDREEVEWRVLGDAAARKDWLPHLRAS